MSKRYTLSSKLKLFFHISWDFPSRSSLHSSARFAKGSIKIYLHKDMLAPSLFRTKLSWIYFSKSFAFSRRSYSNSHKSLQQSFRVFVRKACFLPNSREQPEDIYKIICGSCFTYEIFVSNLAFLTIYLVIFCFECGWELRHSCRLRY